MHRLLGVTNNEQRHRKVARVTNGVSIHSDVADRGGSDQSPSICLVSLAAVVGDERMGCGITGTGALIESAKAFRCPAKSWTRFADQFGHRSPIGEVRADLTRARADQLCGWNVLDWKRWHSGSIPLCGEEAQRGLLVHSGISMLVIALDDLNTV